MLDNHMHIILTRILSVIVGCSLCSFIHAEQYQSNELLEPKGQSDKTVKSIKELESELNSLNDSYAKDSTARYLARHYAQKNNKKSVNKAIEYYRLSLAGKGLSIYAKQVTMLELLALYYQHKLYKEFTRGLDQYKSLEGKLTVSLNIKAMLAYYHLNKVKKSVQLANHVYDDYLKSKYELEIRDLNHILFVFYNVEYYLQALNVQKSIVVIDQFSVDQWLRLSKLYLKIKQPDQAAEILLLITQKGLLLEQDDLILMSDLIYNSGNPFIAARLFQQLMDEFRVDHNSENFDRLFKYWYLSQELSNASLALKASLKYDSNIKRYLDLAELYYQQRDWKNMNETIKEACSFPVARKHTGRANLLLGISELKLNNHENAIDAFNNASMISGKVDEALAYLKYLNVDSSHFRRYERISGVCEPAES